MKFDLPKRFLKSYPFFIVVNFDLNDSKLLYIIYQFTFFFNKNFVNNIDLKELYSF